MNLPQAVQRWIEQQGHGDLRSSEPVSGGCINNGTRLHTTSGDSFFLKLNPDAPADMFAREAEGLEALDVPGGPRVPAPFLVDETFLLLEDLAPAQRAADYWPAFGRQLARLHEQNGPSFGFENDNYLGSTPQPNPWTDDGHEFFATHRLLYQARLARRSGLLSQEEVRRVEEIAGRLSEIVPDQPPSLIHGDLWSGNAISDSQGRPAIIDPAAHYGWAEAELGMTTLFGRFPDSFYRAYEEVRPLQPDWRSRLPLYNLYHLLNHLNLFGRSYLGQVQSLLRRYQR